MIMDFELHTTLNELIGDLFIKHDETYLCPLDVVVQQADKYEGTIYETITIALGVLKGLRKDKYLFNVLEDDNCPDDVSGRASVDYYLNQAEEAVFAYRIEVQPYHRIIKAYEIGYGHKNEPVYTEIRTIDLGKSKWLTKRTTKSLDKLAC